MASLDAFGRSVRTWDLLSPAVMDLVTLAVPPLEVAVSLAWLMNLRRRLCASLMYAMLLVLTLTYSAHLVFRQPPDCGCFGAIRLFEAHQEQAEPERSRARGRAFLRRLLRVAVTVRRAVRMPVRVMRPRSTRRVRARRLHSVPEGGAPARTGTPRWRRPACPGRTPE